MRKNIFILVVSVVLFSLFNTADAKFKLWNTPSVNTNHIFLPEIPISFNDEISVFGLVVNFFTDFELDYSESEDIHSLDIQLSLGLQDIYKDDEGDSHYSKSSDQIISKQDVINDLAVEEVVNSITQASEVINDLAVEEVVNSITQASEVIEDLAVEKPGSEGLVVDDLDGNELAIEQSVVELNTSQLNQKSLPDDEEIIKNHPSLKKNTKKIILAALDDGDITMEDVFDLLNKYAGQELNKKKVKQFIKNNRK